jgi:hypothetical protein
MCAFAFVVTNPGRAVADNIKTVFAQIINGTDAPVPTVAQGTTTVAGTVSVASLPAVALNGAVTVANFPATQNVAGTVAVANLPAVQNVAGSVNVANLPATQNVNVTGGSLASTPKSATLGPACFGLVTDVTLDSSGTHSGCPQPFQMTTYSFHSDSPVVVQFANTTDPNSIPFNVWVNGTVLQTFEHPLTVDSMAAFCDGHNSCHLGYSFAGFF